MKKKIKYVLHPGFIRSETDGEEHYVSADKLAKLYKINYFECFVASEDSIKPIPNDPELIHLYPKYDGKYIIPEE